MFKKRMFEPVDSKQNSFRENEALVLKEDARRYKIHAKKYNSKPVRHKSTRIHNWISQGIRFIDRAEANIWFDKVTNPLTTCEACGILGKDSKSKLVLDHCHDTGRPRAVLCSGCNTLEGLLNKDKSIALATLKYFTKMVSNSIIKDKAEKYARLLNEE